MAQHTEDQADLLRSVRSAQRELDDRVFRMAVEGVTLSRVSDCVRHSKSVTSMLERLALTAR